MLTICFYLLVLIISVFPLLAHASPIIEFTKERHHQGDVPQGIKVSHAFEFINKGDTVLIIKKLVPS